MNEFEPNGKTKEDEEEEKKFDPPGTEKKCPYDMKTFWKNINDKYFRPADENNLNEVNHLINYNSSYDVNGDNIFSKIGFPKNINSLVGKPSELMLKKNNPELVTKIFGSYLYIDKYDYHENNMNNEDIDEEMEVIDRKLRKIEENNLIFMDIIKRKLEEDSNANLIDLSDPEVNRIRLLNLSKTIFSLQMRQISECISTIKIEKNKKRYLIEFDKSEELPHIMLEEKQYRRLIKLRDTLNTISIYDLFQEKINSIYNNGSNKKSQKKNSSNGATKKTKKQSPIKEKETVQIAKSITINTELCHHCKQKKPVEIMVKCQAHNAAKTVEKPFRHYIINHNTVLKRTKSGAVIFVGDPKEILENHLNKNTKNSKNEVQNPKSTCKRYFCYFCLKGSYDIIVDQVKNKKDFCCPFCLGNCFCTRCQRFEQMLKILTMFISLEGNIEDLKEFLKLRSPILDRLQDNLVINKVQIINVVKHEKSSNKSGQSKSNFLKGCSNEKKVELLHELMKKKEEFERKKLEADAIFNKGLLDKSIVHFHRKFYDLGSSYKLDKLLNGNLNGSSSMKEGKFLNKKKSKPNSSSSSSTTHEEKRGRPKGIKKKNILVKKGKGRKGRPPRIRRRTTRMEKEIQSSS